MIFATATRLKPGRFPNITWDAPRTVGEFNDRPFASNLAITTVVDPRVVDVAAYNFHPKVYQASSGMCYLTHTTHDRDEEGPGMWSRWWTSEDRGTTWTARGVLVPGVSPYAIDRASFAGTRWSVLAVKFVEMGGKVYILFDVSQGAGTLVRPQVGILAVEITGTTASSPFWVFPGAVTPLSGFPAYSYRDDIAGELLRELRVPYGVSWGWGTGEKFPPNPAGADWGELNEYQKITIGGRSMVLARATKSTGNEHLRQWLSVANDGVAHTDWQITGVPNAPTKTCWRKFSDRYIMLVNTDSPSRWQCMAAYSADGLSYVTANTERIRPHTTSSFIEIDDFDDVNKMPTQPLFAGVAKAGATSYFDVCELDNGQYLAAMGERGKEVIRTARWTPMALT